MTPSGLKACRRSLAIAARLKRVGLLRGVGRALRKLTRPQRFLAWHTPRLIHAEIPFLQGYHAAPSDYQRLTMPGLRHLCRRFEIPEVKPCSGPASTFAYDACAFFSSLFYRGSDWLYKIAFHDVFCYMFFPFKYLDRFLVTIPQACSTAFGHSLLARKRASGETL